MALIAYRRRFSLSSTWRCDQTAIQEITSNFFFYASEHGGRLVVQRRPLDERPRDADPRGGNSAQCPSPGVDWYEHEAGASRLNATSNAAELNVSHVLPHNSTRSRGDHNVSNRTR